MNMCRIALPTAVLTVLLIMASCSKNKSEVEEYLIRVDSISHPDTVLAAKAFKISFYGNIGPNACYRFRRFATEAVDNGVNIWVVGEKPINNRLACPDQIPMLDGVTLELTALEPGLFELRVINPGLADVLKTSVVVKPDN